MQSIFRIVGVFLVLSAGCTEAQAVVRYVPSSYSTIQAAIDASVNGDTVRVANGTYTGPGNRDIHLSGKAITVTSANGAASCIIDCQHLGRGFFIHEGEGAGTVISGFTIQNGVATPSNYNHGGGMFINLASPTIANCIIQNNTATDFGGGIACKGGSPHISDCTIQGNSAPNSGGIHFYYGSKAVLTGCSISNNQASSGGGGVGSYDASSPSFSSCTITGNTSLQGGGGAYLENSPAIFDGCTIEGNQTGVTGGGLSLNLSDATIKNSDIISNKTTSATVASSGGGIFLTKSNATILSSTISSNESNLSFTDPNPLNRTNSGGISFHQDSNGVLRNCTITNNKAQERGGVGSWNSAPVIESCSISSNHTTVADSGGGGVGFYGDANAPLAEPVISGSWIHDNTAVTYGGGIAVWQRSPTIIGCVIENNTVEDPSEGSSGGINIFGYTLTPGSTEVSKVINTIVRNNSAPTRGGIYVRSIGTAGFVSIVNALITGNTASSIGGGISCYSGGNTIITNCTISGNSASGTSAALAVDSSNVVVTNSILWDNTPGGITGTPSVTYSDIQGGSAGTGNMNIFPGFAGPGNYHLTPGSPCIDSGTNYALSIQGYDLDWKRRVIDGDDDGTARVDMGVYEYGTYIAPPFPWLLYYNVLYKRRVLSN